MGCSRCNKKTLKANYKLCLRCWNKDQHKFRQNKVNMTTHVKLPIQEMSISKKVDVKDWSGYSYWTQTGKGFTKIDSAPGSGYRQLQYFFILPAFFALGITPIVSLICFIFIILLEVGVQHSRKKYLEENNNKIYKK